jgi:hypothetical protein
MNSTARAGHRCFWGLFRSATIGTHIDGHPHAHPTDSHGRERARIHIRSLPQISSTSEQDVAPGYCIAEAATPQGWLMLTMPGGLAEFARELILARIPEGRECAKARGVKLGRKLKPTPQQT